MRDNFPTFGLFGVFTNTQAIDVERLAHIISDNVASGEICACVGLLRSYALRSMLIPRDLYELCVSGRAFRLSVTTDTGAILTYAKKRTAPIVSPQMVDINGKDGATIEVEAAFQRAEAMTERERLAEGVRINKGGDLVVTVAGRFARTFDARSHAAEIKSSYCPKDGEMGTNRAFIIPRPGQSEVKAKEEAPTNPTPPPVEDVPWH